MPCGPKENQALLNFLHRIYKTIPAQKSLIEIGSGPTIYQIISACNKVDYIIFSDFAQSCREEIQKFLTDDKNSFNWEAFFKYVIELEGKKADIDTIKDYKEKIKSKIIAVIPCDVRNQKPLSPAWFPQFDILSMHSVAEGISSTEKEFVRCIKNAVPLVKSGGYFIGMFVKNSKIWKCGEIWYPSFPVDEKYLKQLFPKVGLSLQDMSTVEAEFEQGYDGLISVFARKK